MLHPLGFAVFDADNHLYEAEDAFTRHLPTAHEDLFRFVEIKGRKKLLVHNVLTEFLPNPTFEVIAKPGAFMPYFSGNNPEGKALREMAGEPIRCPPSFRNAQDRLALLDEQGIAACLMFPTLASLIEERLVDDPYLTQVAIRAYNDWLYDEWPYDFKGRIFTTPIVSPCDVDLGIAELERALERGARAVLLRPAPVAGPRGKRSPFLPEFDPFWARVQESGVVVAMHASDSGHQEYVNKWEGTTGESVAFKVQTFGMVTDQGRMIHDSLASAICHGMLDRFPGVHLVSVENGGHWVPELVRHLGDVYKKVPQKFPTPPLELLKRNVWINPFWEESLTSLIDLVGADRLVFGSDYPHAEGLDVPLAFVDQLADVPKADVERIMSTNMFDLLGVPRPPEEG